MKSALTFSNLFLLYTILPIFCVLMSNSNMNKLPTKPTKTWLTTEWPKDTQWRHKTAVWCYRHLMSTVLMFPFNNRLMGTLEMENQVQAVGLWNSWWLRMAGFTFEWTEWNWHDVAFVVSNVFGKKIYGILKCKIFKWNINNFAFKWYLFL